MKRKSCATVLITVLCMALLTGCALPFGSGLKDKPEDVKDMTESIEEDDGDDEDKPVKEKKKKNKKDKKSRKEDKDTKDYEFTGSLDKKRSDGDDNGGDDNSEPEAKGDPLEGLVAEDILTMFRESRPAKNPGTVEDEALDLGLWVQGNIKKFPKDVREKGEEIGRNYEFWFGTDIGNNFDDNFQGIYGTYYTLKDYYTSEGSRNREFYERVSEADEYLGAGDPENIEKMYSDMRDFITDCNNIIRNK